MSRGPLSPKIRVLAGQLIACEAAARSQTGEDMPAALRVAEKLRLPLFTIAGRAACRSLLNASLRSARASAPEFDRVHITPEGSLDGWHGSRDPDRMAEAGAILISQLLGLLISLVGEAVTLKLIREVWPDIDLQRNVALERQAQERHQP